MNKEKILLVEDDQGFREQLKWALPTTYDIYEADSLKSSLAISERQNPSVVCMDMNLENKATRGLEIIQRLLSLNRHAKIIVITGSQDKVLGAQAIEYGACDFLTKPIDIDELKVLVSRAFRISELEEPNLTRLPTRSEFREPLIQGDSSSTLEILEKIKRLAVTDVSVLITGESGTGKELCARAIHFHSHRKNKPFIPINCGAIPSSLLESELFGYVKGAFTGADTDKRGLIHAADQGTLLLDEIGDMSVGLQVKLLRFLEDQQLQRLGDVEEQKLNVRIVAATNKLHSASNLENSPPENALRSDLYYRLSEFEIHLPPLRERRQDIFPIANSIIEKNKVRFNQPDLSMSRKAKKVLLTYQWPGNIRELKNRLNRASLNCTNQVIDVEDLEIFEEFNDDLALTETKRLMEKNIVERALNMTNFNVSQASKKMGISRPTFYNLMKKYNISSSSSRNTT